MAGAAGVVEEVEEAAAVVVGIPDSARITTILHRRTQGLSPLAAIRSKDGGLVSGPGQQRAALLGTERVTTRDGTPPEMNSAAGATTRTSGELALPDPLPDRPRLRPLQRQRDEERALSHSARGPRWRTRVVRRCASLHLEQSRTPRTGAETSSQTPRMGAEASRMGAEVQSQTPRMGAETVSSSPTRPDCRSRRVYARLGSGSSRIHDSCRSSALSARCSLRKQQGWRDEGDQH